MALEQLLYKINSLSYRYLEIILKEGFRIFILKVYRKLKDRIIELLPLSLLSPRALYILFSLRANYVPFMNDATPLDLRYIDPNKIKFHHFGQPKRYGQIYEGEWDRQPFFTYQKHKQIKNIYHNGKSWEDSERYQNQYEEKSKEFVTEYKDRVDDIYNSIKENGYKTQKELLIENPTIVREQNNDCFHPLLNEIGVSIDRNGRISKGGAGGHRLAIAKILQLNEVPVVVRGRDSECQKIRDKIVAADSKRELDGRTKKYLLHPDLVDVVPENWK